VENKKKKENTKFSYLESIDIQKFFTIDSLNINNLSDKREIYFLGENGDGKTLVLQAILLALRGNTRNGVVIEHLNHNQHLQKLQASDSEATIYSYKDNYNEQKTSCTNVFAYGVNRFHNKAFERETEGYLTLFSNRFSLISPAEWLQAIDYAELKGEPQNITTKIAIELLQELVEKNIEILITTKKVLFFEKRSELEFSQLSDGYKNVLTIVCDLLSRLTQNQPQVSKLSDFSAIVLIDELDLFLHPRWQHRIVSKLRKWFPKIQWIFTTHSPELILGASSDAIFYKLQKKEGRTEAKLLDIDIQNISPNILLTSPLFDSTAVPFSNKDFAEFRTNETWWDLQYQRYIESKAKAQTQTEHFFNLFDNLLSK